MRDQMRGGGEDMAGRAIIALEPDHLGAGEIVLEAQDVVDLGPAPAIDRLVVVADHAEIARTLRQQPQPQILRNVGVLIFVHQHVAEAILVLRQHVGVLAENAQVMQQQVAEVGGVQSLEPLLIGRIDRLAAPVGEIAALAGGNIGRHQPAVLPAVDHRGEQPRRPALLVDVGRADDLLHQPDLVVGVENREIVLEPHEFRVTAQDFRADRVKRAEPGHALDRLADHRGDAQLHLARGFVGEGDGEDLRWVRAAGGEDVRDAGGQHPRLAGTRAGQHQQRPVERLDRLALLRVQPFEIGRPRRRAGARGDSAPPRRGRVEGDVLGVLGRPRRQVFQGIGHTPPSTILCENKMAPERAFG